MGSGSRFLEAGSCPHNPEYECASCATARHDLEHPEDVEGCRVCRFRGQIQISPQATPSRRNPKAAPATADPSWEKGIARDSRGMPLLKADGSQIGVKEYGERRHELEAARRRLRTDPHVARPKEH